MKKSDSGKRRGDEFADRESREASTGPFDKKTQFTIFTKNRTEEPRIRPASSLEEREGFGHLAWAKTGEKFPLGKSASTSAAGKKRACSHLSFSRKKRRNQQEEVVCGG